ncbi:uncharacterized protein CIMG_03068 [Coccidioides immitis RS]|uniref:Hydrophobin n=1 Tax=Coccidioides immitis (strain RS) TaxID=246410 RepID=J3KAJ2_COCIM|nr:uncharacterized protein CIMG_03068 [Coccidioides immitis RS]EAS32044.3 hypothetical protein CIMG_03068 [Coccidioides immitis RS]
MHLTTLIPTAMLFAVTMVVLVGTADAVWTCPSGRDPLCCARYTDEGKVEGVVIGSECNEAPRTARCGDASNPLCCKPNFDGTNYCDSEAKGWTI